MSEDDSNLLFDLEISDNEEEIPKVAIGEYWKIRNGSNYLYAQIVKDNPLEVKYFEPSAKGKFHVINETIFEVLSEDLDEKIDSPEVITKGRGRKYYKFM